MITSNALTPDVSMPPVAAVNPEATPAPTPKGDDAQPRESFAKLMGDTMGGGQGQPSNTSTVSPTKPTKGDQKDKGKSSETASPATVLPTIVMGLPVPPAPVPMTQKVSMTGGKTSTTTGIPPVPNPAVSAKNDGTVSAAAAPFAPVPGDSKAALPMVPTTVNKGTPEVKTPSPMGDGLNNAMVSKLPSVDTSSDDPHHHEDHPQQQPPSLAPSPVSIPVPTVAGTGTAKQVVAMKQQEKVEGNARTAEKNLPHGSFLPDSARSAATDVSPRPAVVPQAVGTQASASSTSTAIALGGAVPDKTGAIETQPGIESVRSPRVDKVLAEVSDTAVSFKRIGTESVDVNLQPDRGTEISLHMTLSNGQVEVAARLERGNFDSLNTHWSDLQTSLAQQGIRVGQLEHSSLQQNPDGNQNRNQPMFTQTMQQELGGQRQHSSGSAPEIPDEPVPVGTSATPPRAQSSGATNPARRGWEMWA